MTLSITDSLIESDLTQHKAENWGVGWYVTWLDGPPMDRNTAITAMSLAEIANCWNTTENFPLAAAWAEELGMAAGEAVQMILDPRTTPEGK